MVDYIIVGAGFAGCALAEGLSADGHADVVLLEAGRPDRRPEIKIPAAFPRLFDTPLTWSYYTEPQPNLKGRQLFWPRGKTLGGCSSVNAQIWTRGHRADYEEWDDAVGWKFDELRQYFDSIEKHADNGEGGAVWVQELQSPHPGTADFLAACHAVGIPPLTGSVMTQPEGAGLAQVTHYRGLRWSAADAYLRPVRKRPNLQVHTEAQVTALRFRGSRCSGVEYRDGNGCDGAFDASREVILCAGAITSPHLLMLSGIGDPAHLAMLGIEVRVPLSTVGALLADHLFVPLAFADAKSAGHHPRDDVSAVTRFLATRRGPLGSNLAEAFGFLGTQPGLPAPDIELLWLPVPFLDHGRSTLRSGLTLGIVLLRPTSRGSITLVDADPMTPPQINPAYLSDAEGTDLAALLNGIDRARDVLAAEPLASRIGQALTPGSQTRNRGELAEFVRGCAETLYHPLGTCRMGDDATAVVDPTLRVHGAEGLRVVDASVLPAVPRAHPQAQVVLVARRAVDLIRAQYATCPPKEADYGTQSN